MAQSDTFNLENIARNYAKWVESNPFDMGFTTSYSLGSYRQIDVSHEGYAAVMKKSASKKCMASKANGSLMRITPLAIWGHRLEAEEIARLAKQDTFLSHPNATCAYAVACYCIAIATLIQYPNQRGLAFNNAKTWLNSQADVVKDSYQDHCWQK